MKKRYKAQSQGSLKVIWNVLDTKYSIQKAQYSGDLARSSAIYHAKQLNLGKRKIVIDNA